MQAILPSQISTRQLAQTLSISERAVHLRAKKGGWPCIYKKGKGGSCHLYLVSGLPEDVRATLAARVQPRFAGAAAQAGYARARELSAEAAAADHARQMAKEAGLAAYRQLPEARKTEAKARLEILRARDAFLKASNLSKKNGTTLFIREYKAGAIKLEPWVEAAVATHNGTVSLSWASLYRWEKAFTESGLAGLAGQYAATRTTSIAKHMQDFIKGLLTDRPHLGIPTVHQAVQARFAGQAIPGQSALRRYVAKWKEEHKSLIQYVTSFDQWRSNHMIALGKADEQVTRLNQIWEFDSTPGDVMLVDGRHTLIGAIDVYSRRAKLHVAPSSKAEAVAALTRRAILDWGVPEIAKTDNGSDYVSSHMVRVFESLEIDQILCRPFHPEDKPHIERFFWTVLHGIVELLPGYIGHSVAERKQIEDRRSFAQRIMSQGEEPVNIQLTAGQLQEICDRWCAAVYHHDPHRGLAGATPDQMVRAWTAPIRRITDERALDVLLCPAPDREGTRVIGKDGIRVQNGTFIAPQLGAHEGESVFVLLDPMDWGSIYVFLIKADGRKEFLCRAVDPLRTGHDRAQIASKARAIQDRVMREGRKELKRLARQAATEEIGKEILAFRESKLANIHPFPQKSEEYTTAAMDEASRAVEEIRRHQLGPQPIDISAEEERAAAELIDMNAARRDRPLPATAQEKYEQLHEDLAGGMDLSDTDLAWMKRYELWLETGERVSQY
jgi:putative transposase